jgi:hypothetical protein
MRTAARVLVLWLLAALAILWRNGQLPEFIAGAGVGSLVAVGVGAVVRWQLTPSRYNRPSLPDRYRLADDVSVPLAVVVAVAESEAERP